MEATIDVWQFRPEPEDDEPGFMTYRFAGTIDGKPYCGDVSMEIDGRDGEYDHLWGVRLADEMGRWGDEWDAVLTAMCDNKELEADMQRRSDAYYDS